MGLPDEGYHGCLEKPVSVALPLLGRHWELAALTLGTARTEEPTLTSLSFSASRGLAVLRSRHLAVHHGAPAPVTLPPVLPPLGWLRGPRARIGCPELFASGVQECGRHQALIPVCGSRVA